MLCWHCDALASRALIEIAMSLPMFYSIPQLVQLSRYKPKITREDNNGVILDIKSYRHKAAIK